MPKISALIHTCNDASHIGRTLDSLQPCDEVLLVDHDSADDTARIAREHGVTVKTGIPGVDNGAYALDARHDWILCLCPNESLSTELQASLHKWKEGDQHEGSFSMGVRQHEKSGWKQMPSETRLVNRVQINWTANLPPNNSTAQLLKGYLLRFIAMAQADREHGSEDAIA